MALADPDDVEQALKRALSAEESEYIDTQLEEASDLVLGYLRCDALASPTPGPVRRVVASMVAALLRPTGIPENAEQLSAGEYSMKLAEGSTSKSPWLTAVQKMRLAPYRCGSAVSVPLVSERFES